MEASVASREVALENPKSLSNDWQRKPRNPWLLRAVLLRLLLFLNSSSPSLPVCPLSSPLLFFKSSWITLEHVLFWVVSVFQFIILEALSTFNGFRLKTNSFWMSLFYVVSRPPTLEIFIIMQRDSFGIRSVARLCCSFFDNDLQEKACNSKFLLSYDNGERYSSHSSTSSSCFSSLPTSSESGVQCLPPPGLLRFIFSGSNACRLARN